MSQKDSYRLHGCPAVWRGSVQQVFNYDLSHIYTNSPWCCLSVLSFSSKSNGFNLIPLLIGTPVLMNFCLCNKHRRAQSEDHLV